MLPLSVPHLHVVGGRCPTCDQAVPRDRLEEINARLEKRERERTAEITQQLSQRFEREKAAALDAERQKSTTQMAVARQEERTAADARAQEQIVAAQRANEATVAALNARVAAAEADKTAFEQERGELRALVEHVRRDGQTALMQEKANRAAGEAEFRAEAMLTATRAVETQLAELASGKTAAESAAADLQTQLRDANDRHRAASEAWQTEAAARESVAREEGARQANAETGTRIAELEKARADADEKAATVGAQFAAVQETHETQLAERLHEQREALELAKTEAVNAERSAFFEKELKLSNKVEELQRALENKTAEELGEGAEIDLFEALKAQFEEDRIERINKGQPGADIRHVVKHNGKECGTIIYDSKNHNGWRNDFVTKLSSDQMAAKADHAILSTRKFPAGGRQLVLQDGIMIASPARVVVLAQIVREHVVQTHTMRMSNEEKAQKTSALYAFITSKACADLFARIDTHTDDLLDIDVKEKAAHDKVWKKRGEITRAIQRVRGELSSQIGVIIGTCDREEEAAE
jgi:hypothetical protein